MARKTPTDDLDALQRIHEKRHPSHPFQFTLRQLMIFVTIFCLLCSFFGTVDIPWAKIGEKFCNDFDCRLHNYSPEERTRRNYAVSLVVTLIGTPIVLAATLAYLIDIANRRR
jgi:hypothetical protein